MRVPRTIRARWVRVDSTRSSMDSTGLPTASTIRRWNRMSWATNSSTVAAARDRSRTDPSSRNSSAVSRAAASPVACGSSNRRTWSSCRAVCPWETSEAKESDSSSRWGNRLEP
ncbi:hypothetical protein GCM10027075_48520 [Streptomyces heilongjiangensis]